MTAIKRREWGLRIMLINHLDVSFDLYNAVQQRTWEALEHAQQVVDNLFIKTDLMEYVEITATRDV
jgi:hypothetical protein